MSVNSIAASTYGVGTNYAANNNKTDELKKAKNTDLGMQDFFDLLAAQMKNQDMMNPTSDTEFVAQMAQFSALSATQELNNRFNTFMAVSYVGKNVTATQIGTDGKRITIEGIVNSVEFSDDNTYVTVNNSKVSLDQITKISN